MATRIHKPRGRPRAEHPKQVLSIAFDPHTLEALDTLSDRMDIAKGQIVREAVTAWLKKLERAK